jgi:hypothetical protein
MKLSNAGVYGALQLVNRILPASLLHLLEWASPPHGGIASIKGRVKEALRMQKAVASSMHPIALKYAQVTLHHVVQRVKSSRLAIMGTAGSKLHLRTFLGLRRSLISSCWTRKEADHWDIQTCTCS